MNIYISNLSYSTDDNSLKQLFEAFGEVSSAKVIKDRETGRSRGFGFVEMSDDDQAKEAISKLNETDVQGKNIRVSEARPKTDNKPRRDFGNNRGGRFQDRGNKRYE